MKWHSVDENKKPTKYELLMLFAGNRYYIGYYAQVSNVWISNQHGVLQGVTHWGRILEPKD